MIRVLFISLLFGFSFQLSASQAFGDWPALREAASAFLQRTQVAAQMKQSFSHHTDLSQDQVREVVEGTQGGCERQDYNNKKIDELTQKGVTQFAVLDINTSFPLVVAASTLEDKDEMAFQEALALGLEGQIKSFVEPEEGKGKKATY